MLGELMITGRRFPSFCGSTNSKRLCLFSAVSAECAIRYAYSPGDKNSEANWPMSSEAGLPTILARRSWTKTILWGWSAISMPSFSAPSMLSPPRSIPAFRIPCGSLFEAVGFLQAFYTVPGERKTPAPRYNWMIQEAARTRATGSSCPQTENGYCPGRKACRVVGVAFDVRGDPLGVMRRYAREYGDIVCFHVMMQERILLNHPDFIEQVLVVQQSKFHKSELTRRITGQMLGQGLLISEGDSGGGSGGSRSPRSTRARQRLRRHDG